MTYIQPIQRTTSPEQILEPTTTASPPRAGAPMEQVALQNRTLVERGISLLEAFMPPNGSTNPISEAICIANPTVFEKFSALLQNLFSDQRQKQIVKETLRNQVLNVKSFEFFGCDYRHLSEAEKSFLPHCLERPATRTGHCLKILNEIAYDPDLSHLFRAAIVNLNDVRTILSRHYFQDEADFERHVLKFEREGEKLTLAEKVKGYEIIRRMILMVQNSPQPDDTFSIPNIRVMTFNMYFSLSYVPPELWALRHLTLLNLSGGALTSLSSGLANLEQLTNLDVSDNSLTGLPIELTRLTNLISLSIHMNRLVDFPPQVCQLTRLEKLFCGGNPFGSLPAEFGKLINLEFLNLYDNKLTTLPPELKTLTSLTNLIAYPSLMREIPEVMVHFRNLTVLHLYFPDFKRPFSDEVRGWLQHLLLQECDFGGHNPL